MHISFQDARLKELCEVQSAAKRKLGPDCAKKLRTRLSDIEAATATTDLVAGRPHPLSGDRKGQFAVDLAGGVRLVFVPNNDPVPRKDDGSIDWARVTKVRIVFIGDYHD